MDPVLVYVIQDGNLTDSKNTINIFNSPQFIVSTPVIPLSEEQDFDQRQIKWSLEDSLKVPTSPVLIIKNTSISAASPDLIYQVSFQVLRDPSIDLLYLCKWQDRCHLYTDQEYFQGISLSNTYSPQGFQAVVFSPKGRNILLGIQPMKNGKNLASLDDIPREISNGNINAKATSPNLINYDINTATRYKEYDKTVECAPVAVYGKDGANWSSAIIFFLIVVFVVIIAWLLTRIGS